MSAASRATSTAPGDRDADVGRVQRRRVVDAVAEEADHVAAPLERQDDAVLLRRRDAREDVGLLGDVPERAVAHAVDLVARDRAVPRPGPTCAQTWRATSSLSPVRILTRTPSRRRLREQVPPRPARSGSAKRQEAGQDQVRSRRRRGRPAASGTAR